jgi:hypothetical protein
VGLPADDNRNNSGAIDADADLNTTEYVGSTGNIVGPNKEGMTGSGDVNKELQSPDGQGSGNGLKEVASMEQVNNENMPI